MTYFPDRGGEEEPYRQLFLEPVVDTPDGEGEPEEGVVTEDGYQFTERELREAAMETAWRDVQDEEEREQLLARRDFFRASVWVKDLLLVILFTAASLLLILLIVRMVNGAVADLQQNFTVLRDLSGRAPSGIGAPYA